jgi:hypothetical protein
MRPAINEDFPKADILLARHRSLCKLAVVIEKSHNVSMHTTVHTEKLGEVGLRAERKREKESQRSKRV